MVAVLFAYAETPHSGGAAQDIRPVDPIGPLLPHLAMEENMPRTVKRKLLLIQGANMCYLGKRQPEIYGTTTAQELDAALQAHCRDIGVELEIFYTNHEGEAIDRIYRATGEGFDGLMMNPAGFQYCGFALRDCLMAVPLPYVEVHITKASITGGLNTVTAAAAKGYVCGFGIDSYFAGLDGMLRLLDRVNVATAAS